MIKAVFGGGVGGGGLWQHWLIASLTSFKTTQLAYMLVWFQGNISKAIGWMACEFGSCINSPQSKNHHNFGELLTLPPAPTTGQSYHLSSEISLHLTDTHGLQMIKDNKSYWLWWHLWSQQVLDWFSLNLVQTFTELLASCPSVPSSHCVPWIEKDETPASNCAGIFINAALY